MVNRTAKIEQGQCLKDVAIRHCGDAIALFELASLNDLSMTADVPAGTELILPVAYDPKVVDYFEEWALMPASEETVNNQPLGGIGYMGIGIDFRVL